MKVLNKSIKSTYNIKKSKFICFGFLVNTKEDVKTIINDLKQQYSDASHICYAYILDDKTFYYTDAGEPSGTAGKPIYGCLLSHQLNYTLVAVIRYFGGIKFGPGPLRSTYKDVVLNTLKSAAIKSAILTDAVTIHVPYSQVKQINNVLKQYKLIHKYEKEFVNIKVFGPIADILPLLKLNNIKSISIERNKLV